MRCMTRKMDGGAKGYRTESGREECIEVIKGNFGRWIGICYIGKRVIRGYINYFKKGLIGGKVKRAIAIIITVLFLSQVFGAIRYMGMDGKTLNCIA